MRREWINGWTKVILLSWNLVFSVVFSRFGGNNFFSEEELEKWEKGRKSKSQWIQLLPQETLWNWSSVLSHNYKRFLLLLIFHFYPFCKFLKTDIWPWLKQASVFIHQGGAFLFLIGVNISIHRPISFARGIRWRILDGSGKREEGTRSLQWFGQKSRDLLIPDAKGCPLFSNIWNNFSHMSFLFCEAGTCMSKIVLDFESLI